MSTFSMLAGSNPIYNLLPDILGRLSNQNLKEESFRNIMQFLIGSIKKVWPTYWLRRQRHCVFTFDLFCYELFLGQTNGSSCREALQQV